MVPIPLVAPGGIALFFDYFCHFEILSDEKEAK